MHGETVNSSDHFLLLERMVKFYTFTKLNWN